MKPAIFSCNAMQCNAMQRNQTVSARKQITSDLFSFAIESPTEILRNWSRGRTKSDKIGQNRTKSVKFLGFSWGFAGVLLGFCWGFAGVLLGFCWSRGRTKSDKIGQNRLSSWGSPGVLLGFSWGSPGVLLGVQLGSA